jgi:transcriptional regulator NrdR family protein
MKYVIKRRGHSEPYSQSKLEASLIGTCRAVRLPIGEAEKLAELAMQHVEAWLEDKSEVTHLDLRHTAAQALTNFCPDAAYYYATQKEII